MVIPGVIFGMSLVVHLTVILWLWCFLGDLLEDPGDLLDCDTGTRMDRLVVLVVTDVLVSSSAVAEMCEGVSSDSDWEFVEPRSFFFSKKRSIQKSTTDIQKEDDAAHATAEPVLVNRGFAVAN